MKEDILSGFSAVFGKMSSNGNDSEDNSVFNVDEDQPAGNDYYGGKIDSSDDTEPDAEIDIDDSSDVDDTETTESEETSEQVVEITEEEGNEESDDIDNDSVNALFDAILEESGITLDDDYERPADIQQLISKTKELIEANTKSSYANDEIRELDDFVKNGGDPIDFFSIARSTDYDNIDMTNENVQKSLVKEFLSKKGFTQAQIDRKLIKYEDADILEDEAYDAVEFLKEIKTEEKEALLEAQKTSYKNAIAEQQKYYNDVVSEIDSLDSIRGVAIPKEDKKLLSDYIFKLESDGKTKYQKDYAKSSKNLIESAYFTMKGDSLLGKAKKAGETQAVDKLKNALRTNKIGGSKQQLTTGPARPLWSLASNHLLKK